MGQLTAGQSLRREANSGGRAGVPGALLVKQAKYPTSEKERHRVAEPKTKPTEQSVTEFLNKIQDAERREDCLAVAKIMEEITGAKPKMWGSSMVGFGSYHYKGASGREGDWPLTAFAPRKQELTLYIMTGFEKYDELMEQLGKYKTGKGCLYFKRLSDIHVPTLKKLIKTSVKDLKARTKSQGAAG